MKLKKFFTHRADDPMGALNDLSFLLIIYFLVIAGFNTNKGFLINLPSQDKPRVVQSQDLLRLSLNSRGDLLYLQEPLSQEALDELIAENLQVHPNLTVFLSLDPDVPYQRFVDTLHIIRDRKVENFSFSMASGNSGGNS
ncbi:MAG: biopolymer transporter ExbD [Spirochaetales bacterium]|nr:biopolymer transporter ExbD [Spirochaetales bacterium]